MRPGILHPACYVYSARVSVHVVEHPLVHDALVDAARRATPPELFRRMAVRISLLLAAEATRDLPAVGGHGADAARRRPTGGASSADVVVVPVLRAGLGMLDAVLELLPGARVGHIGLQRDETHRDRVAVLLEAAAGPRAAASS